MLRCFAICVVVVLLKFSPAQAVTSEDWSVLAPVMDYLCQDVLVGEEPEASRLESLLAFVQRHPRASETAPRYCDAPGAYHAFALNLPIQHLLRYLYNPQIPEESIKPFSLRASHWLGTAPDVRRLWSGSPLTEPVVLRGMQEDQTTPDQSTGGCYRMRLKRVLLSMPWKNGQVLVSVSVQQGPSEVGTKGYIIGPDSDWRYVYSDEQGLTKKGLGWVDSRIQSNISVAVYLAEPGKPVVNAVFQWMRAGWSGMSVVKESHVQASLKRYEQQMRRVLEAQNLPAPEALEAEYSRLQGLAYAELQHELAPILENWFAQERPVEGDYLSSLSKNELVALLLREKIRAGL